MVLRIILFTRGAAFSRVLSFLMPSSPHHLREVRDSHHTADIAIPSHPIPYPQPPPPPHRTQHPASLTFSECPFVGFAFLKVTVRQEGKQSSLTSHCYQLKHMKHVLSVRKHPATAPFPSSFLYALFDVQKCSTSEIDLLNL